MNGNMLPQGMVNPGVKFLIKMAIFGTVQPENIMSDRNNLAIDCFGCAIKE